MGWLKYVVAGVGGAVVGGPLGAAAAIGVVKGASSIMKQGEDDEKKRQQISSEHQEAVTEIISIQEKREKLLAQDNERKQAVKEETQKAQKEFKNAVDNNSKQDFEQNAQLAIALFAVGFAASSVDGNMSKDEMRELGQFIKSLQSEKLPAAVFQKVQKYKSHPPTLQEAFEEINRLAVPDYKLFRNLICLIINADGGTPTDEEKQLLEEYDNTVFSIACNRGAMKG